MGSRWLCGQEMTWLGGTYGLRLLLATRGPETVTRLPKNLLTCLLLALLHLGSSTAKGAGVLQALSLTSDRSPIAALQGRRRQLEVSALRLPEPWDLGSNPSTALTSY